MRDADLSFTSGGVNDNKTIHGLPARKASGGVWPLSGHRNRLLSVYLNAFNYFEYPSLGQVL